MFPFSGRSGCSFAIAVISVLALLSGCAPTRYAYFQPQRSTIERLAPPSADLVASTDTLPQASQISLNTVPQPTNLALESTPILVAQPAPSATMATSRVNRHSNPESREPKRLSRLFSSIPMEHVAPRSETIDRNSTSRKTHPVAIVALGLSVLGYVPLLLATSGTIVWIMGVTLPLAAVLLGAASLTTINRNKDRYRGRGWAMAAIMLGTGILGLALVAIAAVSKVVLKNNK